MNNERRPPDDGGGKPRVKMKNNRMYLFNYIVRLKYTLQINNIRYYYMKYKYVLRKS